mmetsp:Transcript_16678/g.22845  ORF Transcript_16678/g.22845 Transcript_16678/m.22845 type:complete len:161 (-) Transcript_16678:114-596(-)
MVFFSSYSIHLAQAMSDGRRCSGVTQDPNEIVEKNMDDLPKMICFKSTDADNNETQNPPDDTIGEASMDVEGESIKQSAAHSSLQDDSDDKMINHKQHRILLLWHAAHCTVKEGYHCPVTSHCTEMKFLQRHILSCRNKKMLLPKMSHKSAYYGSLQKMP